MVTAAEYAGAIHKFIRARARENDAVFERGSHFVVNLLERVCIHEPAFGYCGNDGADKIGFSGGGKTEGANKK
jgi:hypothetical protein